MPRDFQGQVMKGDVASSWCPLWTFALGTRTPCCEEAQIPQKGHGHVHVVPQLTKCILGQGRNHCFKLLSVGMVYSVGTDAARPAWCLTTAITPEMLATNGWAVPEGPLPHLQGECSIIGIGQIVSSSTKFVLRPPKIHFPITLNP